MAIALEPDFRSLKTGPLPEAADRRGAMPGLGEAFARQLSGDPDQAPPADPKANHAPDAAPFPALRSRGVAEPATRLVPLEEQILTAEGQPATLVPGAAPNAAPTDVAVRSEIVVDRELVRSEVEAAKRQRPDTAEIIETEAAETTETEASTAILTSAASGPAAAISLPVPADAPATESAATNLPAAPVLPLAAAQTGASSRKIMDAAVIQPGASLQVSETGSLKSGAQPATAEGRKSTDEPVAAVEATPPDAALAANRAATQVADVQIIPATGPKGQPLEPAGTMPTTGDAIAGTKAAATMAPPAGSDPEFPDALATPSASGGVAGLAPVEPKPAAAGTMADAGVQPVNLTAGVAAGSGAPQVAASAPAPPAMTPTFGVVTATPVEVVDIISNAADEGQSDRVVVQLDPPELGRVSIDFKFDGQGLQHVTVTGETPEAVRQLRLLHADLVQTLERHGLGSQNMTFQQQQNPQQQSPAAHPFNRSAAFSPSGPDTAVSPLISADNPNAARTLPNGRLDLRL